MAISSKTEHTCLVTTVAALIQQIGTTIPPKVIGTPTPGKRVVEPGIIPRGPWVTALEGPYIKARGEANTTTTTLVKRFTYQSDKWNEELCIYSDHPDRTALHGR